MYDTGKQEISMTKQEFLDELRSCLVGRVDERELQAQISYYDSYITHEVNSGRTVEEVMDGLGSPRLIAKTVIQAYMAKDDPISRQYNSSYNNDYNNYKGNNSGQQEYYSDSGEDNPNGSLGDRIWKTVSLISVLFVVILVLGFVFRVIIYLIPVFIFITGLYLLIKIFTS